MGSRVLVRWSPLALCLCALLAPSVLAPSSASAQARITSKHAAKLSIPGEALPYIRVGAARPLALQVIGPGTLTLNFRKELDGPRGPTLIQLMRNGRQLAKLRLAATGAVSLAGDAGQAGAPQNRKIEIPGGSHKILVKTLVRGHYALVSYDFVLDIDELPDLVGLSGPTPPAPPAGDDDLGDIALVGLDGTPVGSTVAEAGPSDDLDAIPLVGLTPDRGDDDAPDPANSDIELVGLVDDAGPGETTVSGGETAVAVNTATSGTEVSVDTFSANRGSGALIGAPLNPDTPAPTPRKPGTLVLGLRGVAARVGLGSGAMGGGLDLLLRLGLLSGKLLLGVSVDFLPQRLYQQQLLTGGASQRFDVSLDALPILAGFVYQLGKGSLRFWLAGSAGVAWVRVGRESDTASAIHPAGALAFGPALRLGPGHLTAALRLTASHGGVKDPAGGTDIMSAGTLAGAGLTLGYALEL
ncbi:MAG: hypothetical protein P1V51_15100 [Deltaproteobacteria bacterium]|nr:hypothetical protein [Deltaproteobacteria bacterium]